jgi:hypothetical protein
MKPPRNLFQERDDVLRCALALNVNCRAAPACSIGALLYSFVSRKCLILGLGIQVAFVLLVLLGVTH